MRIAGKLNMRDTERWLQSPLVGKVLVEKESKRGKESKFRTKAAKFECHLLSISYVFILRCFLYHCIAYCILQIVMILTHE